MILAKNKSLPKATIFYHCTETVVTVYITYTSALNSLTILVKLQYNTGRNYRTLNTIVDDLE